MRESVIRPIGHVAMRKNLLGELLEGKLHEQFFGEGLETSW